MYDRTCRNWFFFHAVQLSLHKTGIWLHIKHKLKMICLRLFISPQLWFRMWHATVIDHKTIAKLQLGVAEPLVQQKYLKRPWTPIWKQLLGAAETAQNEHALQYVVLSFLAAVHATHIALMACIYITSSWLGFSSEAVTGQRLLAVVTEATLWCEGIYLLAIFGAKCLQFFYYAGICNFSQVACCLLYFAFWMHS